MSAYGDLVLLDRPVAYWPLQEASGASTAGDLTGHGHDMAYHLYPGFSAPGANAPEFGATGPFAGQTAVQAHLGTQQSVLLAANPATLPDTTGPFSWEAWLYWDSTAAGALHYSDFLGWSSGDWGYDGFNTTLRYYTLAAGGAVANTLNAGVGDFGARSDCVQTATGAPTTDAWHHVVLVSDGTVCMLYVDRTPLILMTADAAPMQDNGSTARFWLAQDVALAVGLPGRLAHVALYDVALKACQIESHYDQATTGAYTPCPEWVRLSHRSGQGYWQSRGDVTEEWAGGAKRLELPLATLPATPRTLVGQDPTTSLPAYCPAPVPTTTTVVLGGGGGSVPAPVDTCMQVRCGVSSACAGHLVSLYEQWADWLQPLLEGVATFALLALVIDPFFDALIAGMEVASDIAIATGIKALLAAGAGAITGNLFDVLNLDELADLQRPLFCELICNDDAVIVTATNITVWHDAVATLTTLPGLSRDLLTLLLQFTPLANWQAAAAQAGPSSACDAWTCPS